MKSIEYRAIFNIDTPDVRVRGDEEVIRVQARSINSGYAKALKIARQPLGSGVEREIVSLQFWAVI